MLFNSLHEIYLHFTKRIYMRIVCKKHHRKDHSMNEEDKDCVYMSVIINTPQDTRAFIS